MMMLILVVVSSVSLITAQSLHWQKQPVNTLHHSDHGFDWSQQSRTLFSSSVQTYDYWPKNISEYCDAFPDEPNPPEFPIIPGRYTCKMEVLVGGQEGEPTPGHPQATLLWEEVYDEPGNRMAVDLTSTLYVEKYIMNWNTQQMIQILKRKNTHSFAPDCVVSDIEAGAPLFPPIGLNISNAHIVGPGALMGIVNWTDANYKGAFQSMEKTRGITAYRWDWCGLTGLEDETGHNVSMATYWSVPEWNMPTTDGQIQQIPLGWEVELQHQDGKWDWIHETYVHNVLSFYPHAEDPLAFLIPPGINCADLAEPPNSSFPDFATDRFFSFHLEARQSGIKTLQNIDGWYDFEKQLYRIDHYVPSPKTDAAPFTLWTDIFDFNIGIVYSFPRDTIYMCKFPTVNDSHSDWDDMTGIGHLWADSPEAFFGLDQTNYTYYGKREVRGIRADEWRGIRTDWPTSDPPRITLWEWTFAAKNVTVTTSMGEHIYEERQVPIDLSVTAMEDIETIPIPEGTWFNYQMFDFVVDSDERSALFTDGSIFDVYDCFSANWRDHWKFQLDVSGFLNVFNSPLLTSGFFTSEWHKMLAREATVSPIRITRVQVTIVGDKDVWIEYVILARPKVSDHNLYESMTPIDTAEENLFSAVEEGKMFMEGVDSNGEHWKLVPMPGTLQKIFDVACSTPAPPTTTPQQSTTPHTTTTTTPHTTPTTTPHTTTTTTPHSTVSTTPHSNAPITTNVVTATSHPNNPTAIYTGGDLAGIGIGMIIAGLALGAAITFSVQVKRWHLAIISICKK